MKIFPLGIFTAIIFLFPLLSLAAPWSERHAFCIDRVVFSGSYSNYRDQKIYNECMENADARIAEFERNGKQAYENFLRQHEQQQIDYRKENKERQKRKKVLEQKKELANQQEIQKVNDLFSEF